MKPEDAINVVIGYGPYTGKTIGWVAKFGRVDGLQWMMRQYSTARLQPDLMEAFRSFFAAPKYAGWLKKVLPNYPGPEPFWLLKDSKGCLACAGTPLTTSIAVACSHHVHRGYRHVVKCPCGWGRELKDISTRLACDQCDSFPLFVGVLP